VSIDPSPSNFASIEVSLAKIFAQSKGQSTLTIPALLLSDYTTNNISVTYKNFLGSVGTSYAVITTSTKYFPFIEIVQDMDLRFKTWQNIQLTASFQNLQCTGGSVVTVDEPMHLKWYEVTDQRNPSTSKPIFTEWAKNELIEFDTGSTSTRHVLNIPPFTASVDTTYFIAVQVTLL
jgi:hypothetical protein